jgi:hypothetical protein
MPKSKRDPADELRSVAPREFVAARRALAARLNEQGDREGARRVARLPRPSPVPWALNRAATARPRELTALVEGVDRLRRAQLGQGDLRAATEGYRIAFEPLVRAAREALEGAGTKASAELDRRLRSTLLAAVADRGLRADLTGGRLESEHADPGFAVLSGGPIPAAFMRERSKAPRGTTAPAAAPRARGAETRGAPPAAEPARPSRPDPRAARRLAREARRREQAARQAERAAQTAERRVSAARQRLSALERRSAALRAAADRARADAGGAGAGEAARPVAPREDRR